MCDFLYSLSIHTQNCNMKIIILVLCTLAVVVYGKLKDNENWKECLAENVLKAEQAENLTEEVDPKFRCFMACFLEKQGIIKDREIDKETLIKNALEFAHNKINKQKVLDLIDTCMEAANDTSEICLRAHQIGICITNGLQKMDTGM